jgi:4-amino-4-deoxy-L-arabinose transferase-like glycosyltransferase
MAAGSFPRTFVLVAAAAGLLARLAFGFLYWVGEPLNRDEVEYLSLARSLTAGHGYEYDEHVRSGPVQPFGRAPGYPVFLTLIGAGRALVDHVPASVQIAQSIAGGLGVIVIGFAAFRMAGRRPAMAAAAIAALHPPLVWISGYVYSEGIFWPIGVAVALLTSRMLDAPSGATWKAAAIVGVATGLAVLVRAATMPFVGIAAAWLAWKRRPAALAAFLVGVALVVTPWSAYMSSKQGRFVLVASDGGVTFWTGNNALAIGEGDMAANPHLKLANQALRAKHPDLSEEQMEPVYYRESFTWIRAHPLDWLWLMVKKVFYLVVPIGPSYSLHSTRYYLASVVSVGALLLLAAAGGRRLGSRRSRLAGMWLLAAAAVATCLVFFPQERFRIPVIDPALILLASGVWATQWRMDPADAAAGRRAA